MIISGANIVIIVESDVFVVVGGGGIVVDVTVVVIGVDDDVDVGVDFELRFLEANEGMISTRLVNVGISPRFAFPSHSYIEIKIVEKNFKTKQRIIVLPISHYKITLSNILELLDDQAPESIEISNSQQRKRYIKKKGKCCD